jgi:hypothetical protein
MQKLEGQTKNTITGHCWAFYLDICIEGLKLDKFLSPVISPRATPSSYKMMQRTFIGTMLHPLVACYSQNEMTMHISSVATSDCLNMRL